MSFFSGKETVAHQVICHTEPLVQNAYSRTDLQVLTDGIVQALQAGLAPEKFWYVEDVGYEVDIRAELEEPPREPERITPREGQCPGAGKFLRDAHCG